MNLQSSQEQKTATHNPTKFTKPSIPRASSVLNGYNIGSMNGGLLKPIGYKRVQAGEKIYNWKQDLYIKMLTPLTPNYQKLKMVLKAYFVPDSRVWTNAEKFYGQKGGTGDIKITKMPKLGETNSNSINAVKISISGTDTYINYLDTEMYRDSFVSTYMPRVGGGYKLPITWGTYPPPINVLPLRGFKAIYNDYERRKDSETQIGEYNGDTVTSAEFNSYFPVAKINAGTFKAEDLKEIAPRGMRQESYYTDYRTDEIDTRVPGTVPTTAVDFNEWLERIAEGRAQAENENLNDWEIIAKMGGTRKAMQGKVMFLGKKEIGLNYTPVTQTAYNTDTSLEEEFQKMGTQGAYSFTKAENVELFHNVEFIENGTIHILAQVTTDTIFDNAVERTLLNTKPDELYRPEYKDMIDDILYQCESGVARIQPSATTYTAVQGYKRKFSELFKMPNVLMGDITKTRYYKIKYDTVAGVKTFDGIDENQLLTQESYAFIDDKRNQGYHLDYTDTFINQNQAIQQDTIKYSGTLRDENRVIGQNQIYFVGQTEVIADLPVDEKIKNNFTNWGQK